MFDLFLALARWLLVIKPGDFAVLHQDWVQHVNVALTAAHQALQLRLIHLGLVHDYLRRQVLSEIVSSRILFNFQVLLSELFLR